ncbi:MAG: pyruvate, orthophosphate dikinase [Desulfobacteraceae bacterium Eth-SRB2]|nr:MAG: pyruvate, orthophosphate dikinase [Desulfobacteraceae bacterium Eth-SRB2]
MIQSKALEVNIADYHVDVTIDEKYSILQEVMSKYYGILEGLNNLLKELSHPYKNWTFIVHEARVYSLDYFHLLKSHPKGPEATELLLDIFIRAIGSKSDIEVKADAVDNFLLFIQKIIKESGSDFKKFKPLIDDSFNRIRAYDGDDFFLFVKSFYQIRKLADALLNYSSEIEEDCKTVNLLLIKYYDRICRYWLTEKDPWTWFEQEADKIDNRENLKKVFNIISHKQINRYKSGLEKIAQSKNIESQEVLKRLLILPAYDQFVEAYRKIPQSLLNESAKTVRGNRWKLIFLFHIMNISGLSVIHEEALREINRTLSWLIAHESNLNIGSLIHKTFSILKTRAGRYPATALNCILNMGKGVYKTDDSDLVKFFIDYVIDLGFQSPMIKGVGNDWQIEFNTAHILNIRTWLELIELNPMWSTRLLSYLIIHLSACGVFIKDIDLFPRDITRLLNSGIDPVYNLGKQLCRLFPVFFNDIGAEGKLRDISTEIDEICRRKDPLMHFLRKQSHVESSNRIIDLMEATLNFWETKEKSPLRPFVPPNTYEEIHTQGPYVDGVHRVILHLKENGVSIPDGLVTLKEDEIGGLVQGVSGVSEQDSRRVELAITCYKLLNQKYNLDFIEMENYLAQLKSEAFPDLNRLNDALKESDLNKKIYGLLDYLEELKNIILSDQTFEIKENIYKKRHITIDIPSMYGSYREMKFDALGLTFRIESLVNVLFEELVENIDLGLITKATFFQIYDRLNLFFKALQLDGIPSVEIERQLDMLAHSLEARGFTFTQYIDIFKGFAQAVRNIINDYFNNIHGENLGRILSQISFDQILSKYLPQSGTIDHEKLKHRISEIFFRERIAFSLGLQQLDLFLSRILNILFQQSNKLPKNQLHQLLLYDPEWAMTSINNISKRVSGIIYLGNKGLNLVRLKNLGLPVPPGFIITTEAFRCREILESYPPAEQNFREQLQKHIADLEKVTGKTFGNSKNPLLFSIRSGSSISQPGMMDTFLNVGMNEEIAAGIAEHTGNAWFAWDSYRRFLQCYGMAFGLERDDFDAIISEMKRRAGIGFKREFAGMQMRKVAMTYKSMIKNSGIDVIDDPFKQLYLTIKKVFGSWESSKARAYRKIIGISDDWGTAATVQEMVYGNISRQSGAGVIFTHNPRWSEDSLRLWGDFSIGNQGEDVASGLVNTLPISITQQDIEMRETDITLETHFPKIYNGLKEWSNKLIHMEGWSPQEMEFTFEGPGIDDLYLLQCRDMAIRERKKVLTFDLGDITEDKLLGHGIGVSGGAMRGRIVFSLKEIDEWRTIEPDTYLVFVRNDTVPDDIREIYAADGLLTARGGVTSHAAVVAYRLGKTCIVGCGNLICKEKEKRCQFNKVVLKSGDHVSIDGREGSVYQDLIKVKEA